MPILWRFLTSYFLKITLACVLAFESVLLAMQLDDIAHFAALGAPLHYILLFTFHQIPYILPIALPLSALIGSMLLMQRLSATHELTAMRAGGFSLRNILAPIWLSAAFLSVGNFWIASELSTQSHLQCNLLKTELRSINPLLLLNNKHLMRLKGFYFDALGASRVGESASDVILAVPNRHYERIYLMTGKNLKANSKQISGDRVTLITGMPHDDEEGFDQLLVENIKHSSTNVDDFSDVLQKKVSAINNDYLQMSLLLARINEQREQLAEAKLKEENQAQIKSLTGHLNKSLIEIVKRFSMALSVFCFTLMGTAYGINISRKKDFRSLACVLGLTAFYLAAFFGAKGADHNFWLASALYLAPLIVIISCSCYVLRRTAKGIE